MADINPNMDPDIREKMALEQWEKGGFESAKYAFSMDKSMISDEALSELKRNVEMTNRYFGGEVLKVSEDDQLNILVFIVTHFYKSPPIPSFVRRAQISRKVHEEHPESFENHKIR